MPHPDIATDKKPIARINGDIAVLDFPELTADDVRKGVEEIIPKSARERFEQGEEVDCGFSLEGAGRFRVNVYQEMFLQICREYPGLPDARKLNGQQIRFFYDGLREELKHHTAPK